MAVLKVTPHLTLEELEVGAESASTVGEWRRWRAVGLKAAGGKASEIAQVLQRKEDWVRRTVRHYNERGPVALRDGRVGNRRERLLSPVQEAALVEAVAHEEPTGGGMWTGPKVAAWMEAQTGRPVQVSTAYLALHRLGLSWKAPRPRSVKADAQAQEAFKKKG